MSGIAKLARQRWDGKLIVVKEIDLGAELDDEQSEVSPW